MPALYAIPGNHDWYDGLSSFTRIFCQQGWFGGWKTRQSRSYFAVKLPHNWWLWGIDIQLEGYIDEPQLDYFYRQVARPRAGRTTGSSSASPSRAGSTASPAARRPSAPCATSRTAISASSSPARLKATLTGDLHHYVRYESKDGEVQRITAGGGGAYLFATHDMPDDAEARRGVQGERPHRGVREEGELPRYGDLEAADLRQPAPPDPELEVRPLPRPLLRALQLDPAERQQDPAGPGRPPSLLDYLKDKSLETWGPSCRPSAPSSPTRR